MLATNIDTNMKRSSAQKDLPVYDLFNSTALFPSNSLDRRHTHDQSMSTPISCSPPTDAHDDFATYKGSALKDLHPYHYIKDSSDIIQLLQHRILLLSEELLQKEQTIQALESTLMFKDMKLKEQSQRCLSLSQQIVYGSTDRALLPSENADTKRQCFQQEMEMGRWRHVSTPPPESIAMDPTARWQRRPSIDEEAKSIDYRRTDKPQGNDWEVLVRRILLNTDQQASVYLQQKLKTCNTDQKQAIFQMVHKNAYALMTNRFGNFLVQRLFEWGTPDQVQALANVMDGHILALTCEPFGCHVVQRALDNVNGETKTRMVMELCQHIPETITHKYACHVWQRVFEIRHMHQSVSVMQRVHQALQGKWTRVALDETGSLVIQNIFENLLEPDKRPVLDEILSNIEEIAKGQWGNWVIQHILEQAEQKQDRERAFDMVLLCGIQLSMDQYASKVVEKALSNGGPCYMERFIHHISTESRSYRPRIALIDIASDQYGNYVVQWIINNAADHHKISVCRLIKRHMVSLRGSKYGQRVAFLVEKTLKHHDVTTYPRH